MAFIDDDEPILEQRKSSIPDNIGLNHQPLMMTVDNREWVINHLQNYHRQRDRRAAPALLLEFAKDKELDPRITFTRASSATRWTPNKTIETVAANKPRFDHDPVTGICKGLLIEGARTNLLLQSGLPGGTAGTVGSGAVAPTSWVFINTGGTVSYPTTQYGTVGIRTAITSSQRPAIGQTVTASASTTYAFFCRVAAIDSGSPRMLDVINWGGPPAGATQQWFKNGVSVASSSTFSVGDVIGFLAVISTTAGTFQARIGAGSAVSTEAFDVTLTMPQCEVGSFPTSYIPTTTTALTRSADVCSMTGTNFSDWFNAATEGTFVAEFYHSNTANTFLTSIYEDGADYIAHRYTGSQYTFIRRANTGARNGDVGSGVTTPNTNLRKWAGAWNTTTGGAASFDAGTVQNSATNTTPFAPVGLTFGRIETGTVSSAFHLSRIAFYPIRLSNSILQGLTT